MRTGQSCEGAVFSGAGRIRRRGQDGIGVDGGGRAGRRGISGEPCQRVATVRHVDAVRALDAFVDLSVVQ